MVLLLRLVLSVTATAPQVDPPIQFEIRAFDGSEDVTAETSINIYAAGTRDKPVRPVARPGRGLVAEVPVGIYDAQAIQQHQGQVVNIRWAERLLAQHYPDEEGRHLEVVNFRRGFGALQLRRAVGARRELAWEAAAFAAGNRTQPVGTAIAGDDYVLFALPAGRYDILVRIGGASTWLADVDVPLDRTRMKQVPAQ